MNVHRHYQEQLQPFFCVWAWNHALLSASWEDQFEIGDMVGLCSLLSVSWEDQFEIGDIVGLWFVWWLVVIKLFKWWTHIIQNCIIFGNYVLFSIDISSVFFFCSFTDWSKLPNPFNFINYDSVDCVCSRFYYKIASEVSQQHSLTERVAEWQSILVTTQAHGRGGARVGALPYLIAIVSKVYRLRDVDESSRCNGK